MQDKVFDGEGLESALRDDSAALASGGSAQLLGMAKASEEEGHIKFTQSGCGNWVELPISIIDRAEQIGQARCDDEHSHPVFQITLKQSEDPEAQALAGLLAQSVQARGRMGPPQPIGPPSGGYSQTGRRGPFGNPLGVDLNRNVAYWNCNDYGSCFCEGFWDCIDMINSAGCREVKCYTGWVTGEVVCICSQ